MPQRASLAYFVLLLFAASAISLAEEHDLDGATLYTERGCVYCHGPAGKEPALPDYPKLDGQNKEYLILQMQDIKSRARDNGYTGMMQPAVLSVSDEEFAAIAEFLAEQ
ncbi:MAG: c-type cytochrome [Gammaproteobacteria bacterium]|nr:c-type cytochrome [Gammaproteobacteria bacterium]